MEKYPPAVYFSFYTCWNYKHWANYHLQDLQTIHRKINRLSYMQQITLAIGKLLQSGSHSKVWLVSSSWGQAELEAPLHRSPVQRGSCNPVLGWCSAVALLWWWHSSKSALGLPRQLMFVSCLRTKSEPCWSGSVKMLLTHMSFFFSLQLSLWGFQSTEGISMRDATLSSQNSPWNHELIKQLKICSVSKAIHLHGLYKLDNQGSPVLEYLHNQNTLS